MDLGVGACKSRRVRLGGGGGGGLAEEAESIGWIKFSPAEGKVQTFLSTKQNAVTAMGLKWPVDLMCLLNQVIRSAGERCPTAVMRACPWHAAGG